MGGRRKAFRALALGFFMAARASAQDQQACLAGAFDGSGDIACLSQFAPPAAPASPRWERDQPQPPGGGGPATPPDSPTGPEWQRFWENLQSEVFDDICKNIKLPLKYDYRPEFGSVRVAAERRLARFPDKKLAIVDRTDLSVSLGYSHPVVEGAVPVTLGIEARADGRAYVIRPLDRTSDCGEVKTLLNVLDFKTFFPISAERLASMEVRELWKLPIELRASARIGAGYSFGPASLGISIGASQGESASITLVRLSPEALRLRVRIDRANVIDASGAVTVGIPVGAALGLEDSSNFFEKQGDKLLLREINRYLANSLGAGYWKRDGRKAMLEFILDPRDPEQMERLAEFLKGNLSGFSVLRRIVKAASDPLVRNGEISDDLSGLEARNAEALGARSAFAGASDYERAARRLHVRIPFLTSHEGGSERQEDLIVSGDRGHQLKILQRSERGGHAWFDIPFLGQIYKSNSEETVQAMIRVDSKGFPDAPFLAYIQQEGQVRHSEASARAMAASADAVMRLAGTRGEGPRPDLALPVAEMFPARSDDRNPTYRSAISAFSIVFNQQSIQEILWAPAEIVVRAFLQALPEDDRASLALALGHGAISAAGELSLDRGGLRRELWRSGLDAHSQEGRDLLWDMERLAKRAAGLVRDLVEARKEDWEQRVRALAALVDGKGRSGLEYAGLMKVLVQLADPAEMYAEFRLQTHKKIKGEEDVSARYQLNKDRQSPAFKEALQLKERFSDPALLSD